VLSFSNYSLGARRKGWELFCQQFYKIANVEIQIEPCSVIEVSVPMGYDVGSLGNRFLTFRYSVFVTKRREILPSSVTSYLRGTEILAALLRKPKN
jgi:hypothetical protein